MTTASKDMQLLTIETLEKNLQEKLLRTQTNVNRKIFIVISINLYTRVVRLLLIHVKIFCRLFLQYFIFA